MSNFTNDINKSAVNTGIVDILLFPMVAAKSTIAYLQEIMPGQSEAWYDRIAAEITAGRMPLPKVESIPDPTPKPTEEPVLLPNAINPARQRYLASNDSPAPTAKPKSKTKQLKQGTYRAKSAASTAIPNTVGEALKQASQPQTKRVQPANATTKWKLESLVHGDRNAASRLAAQIAFANPDKTEQWCWEKAIYDLRRDRF
jgi:hypothetical protein